MATTARGWKPSLKYSPVNGIIVDWGIGSETFSLCCMPQPNCEVEYTFCGSVEESCGPENIIEPVDTYDWHRWVPEIIVGLESASEDMAASYARRAAIKFARLGRVLQREVLVQLQQGVYRYPLTPFEDESVQGIVSIDSAEGKCQCDGCDKGPYLGEVGVNIARQELTIIPHSNSCGCHINGRGPKWLKVTVWSAPTEDSCKHDVFLYEQYREQITMGARSMFLPEAHGYGAYKTNRGYASARGDSLIFQRADMLKRDFDKAIVKARVEAYSRNSEDSRQPAPVFATGCSTSHRRR